ncbi:peptidyl-tRNA hydrolase [Coniochaeta ligniaria NRRL 30616]|uniref:peptidyl-tRNA hydrolase n=1 Tax=Coniochaeta ligniaria NRRL 30616 TaxID=1408157 RepID=A0A1J7JHV6_9PEZI|nr:peptidyl-tRNA hydrolase [Coniochaeta ligniaria NRRL 30616]
MPISRFLVISLGNPSPYLGTLHSAGHLALEAVQRLLSPDQPPFIPERYGKRTALASAGPRYIFLQSPTLMNVSGPWVATAWKDVVRDQGEGPLGLPLVLVHDDLEEDLGVVKVKHWKSSHRGHNGVKSVHASLDMGQYPGALWARVSVGIGRPEGRDRSTVSEYVLRKMSRWEKSTIQDQAAPGVVRALMELEQKWS